MQNLKWFIIEECAIFIPTLANAKLEEKYQIWNAQKNDNVIGNMILNSS